MDVVNPVIVLSFFIVYKTPFVVENFDQQVFIIINYFTAVASFQVLPENSNIE